MAAAIGMHDLDLLSRNIVGMLIGFLPPIDGNLRSVLYEWLTERTLWRHQAALLRATGGGPMNFEAAGVLIKPITRAMCKRPTPDLLLRVATRDHVLKTGDQEATSILQGDVVIVGLVSAAQRSLQHTRNRRTTAGRVSIVFGGRRVAVTQPEGKPFHACPAREMMMGTMAGIFAALLDVGQIKAMPSSLIVEISNWKVRPPAP